MCKDENALVPKDSQAEKNLATLDIPSTYVPGIKVTYAISDHFIQKKAELGEFYYNNELALGNTMQVTALGYRYQAMAIDKASKEFSESLVLAESDTPFRERKEYAEFCENHKADDIRDGVDILLFLPERNLYGVLFAKKHLLKGGLQILEKASNGSIVQVKTIPKEWKKFKWYILEVIPTGNKVEVPRIEETLEIYNSQVIEASSEDAKGEEDGRER